MPDQQAGADTTEELPIVVGYAFIDCDKCAAFMDDNLIHACRKTTEVTGRTPLRNLLDYLARYHRTGNPDA